MDDTSRDPAITEDEIRALQFSAGDVAEIEQTILSFVDACHTRKVAMVVGSWICPYISRHLLSLNPLLACCRRYSRGER